MTPPVDDERRLAENRDAIARAEEQLVQIRRTLKEAERVRREVVPRLRRAGLVR